MNTKTLARLAFMLVLIIVLDYLSRTISFFRTPNGGTLSFVPTIFMLSAIIAKPLEGFLFGSIASIFTFFFGSQWFVNFAQYLFDYPLAIGGAIAFGSIIYRALEQNSAINYYFKLIILSFSVTVFQFISYTIAFYMYIDKTSISGVGAGFVSDLIIFGKYNLVYMGPIMIANAIVAPLIISRVKNYLR